MFAPWILFISLATASEDFAGHGFWFGDLHVHTGASGDGGSLDIGSCSTGDCGEAATMMAQARADGWDFISVTDHVNGPQIGPDTDFHAIRDIVLAANDPGVFVTIPGAEVFAVLPDGTELGHKTLLMFGDDQALADWTRGDAQHFGGDSAEVASCAELDAWMTDRAASFGDALIIPHHPLGRRPMPTDWTCHYPDWSPAVEVYSSHGASLRDGDAYDPARWPLSGRSVEAALDPGGHNLILGFVGGTDSHDTRPASVCDLDGIAVRQRFGGGVTVAVLDEGVPLTRAALHHAIVERQTYATSGIRLPVDLRVEVDGVAVGGLGEELPVQSDDSVSVIVDLPEQYAAMVTQAWVVTPAGDDIMEATGAASWSWTRTGDELGAWAYVMIELDGDAWYGAGVCDDGGDTTTERVWMSPNWFVVTGVEPPPDTGTPDTGQPDTGPIDTGVVDTGPPPDTTPPVISDVGARRMGRTQFVDFMTDEEASGEVCVDIGGCFSSTLGTQHTVRILRQGANSYTITATDPSGNASVSGPHDF